MLLTQTGFAELPSITTVTYLGFKTMSDYVVQAKPVADQREQYVFFGGSFEQLLLQALWVIVLIRHCSGAMGLVDSYLAAAGKASCTHMV